MTTLEKIITKVDCKYGSPMGRGSYGEPNGKQVYISQVQLDEGYDNGGAYWGNPNNLYVEYTEDLEYIFFFREGEATMTGKSYIPKPIYTLRPKLCKFATKEDWIEEIQDKVDEIYIYLVYNDAQIITWCDPNPMFYCEVAYVDIAFKEGISEDDEDVIWEDINDELYQYNGYYSCSRITPIRDLTYMLRDDEDTLDNIKEMLQANPIYDYDE